MFKDKSILNKAIFFLAVLAISFLILLILGQKKSKKSTWNERIEHFKSKD